MCSVLLDIQHSSEFHMCLRLLYTSFLRKLLLYTSFLIKLKFINQTEFWSELDSIVVTFCEGCNSVNKNLFAPSEKTNCISTKKTNWVCSSGKYSDTSANE
jgi:hypothetical protein